MMDVIVTIPTAARAGLVLDLLSAGGTIFRLNGAHLAAATARDEVRRVRELIGDSARIMIDLPTNKLRTANLRDGIAFVAGDQFTLPAGCFNIPEIVRFARVGDEVIVNDGRNHLRVVRIDDRGIEFLARDEGRLANRRGLIFERSFQTPEFPFLLEADRQLLDVVETERVDLVGVSYLRFPEHKRAICRLLSPGAEPIYKIETREAFEKFSDLIEGGELVLIDRGDLAGEIGLLNVAAAQRQILAAAHALGVDVFVATQFLTSMQQHPVPTLSEVHTLFETIASGVAGVQLSEETALGAFPVQCVEILRRIERQACGCRPDHPSTVGV
jgi:pyruvate kinase